MAWLIIGLLGLGFVLIGLGVGIANGPGSADERVGGSIPIILGGALVVLTLIFAFAWLLFRS